jgi:hypothetical protein
MTNSQRTISIVIGVVGAIGSCLALAGFLLKMRRNDLELPVAFNAQSFYGSVGRAYTGGFTAGFSLCFFLTLLAVAVGTWLEGRRDAAAGRKESVRMPLVEKGPPG